MATKQNPIATTAGVLAIGVGLAVPAVPAVRAVATSLSPPAVVEAPTPAPMPKMLPVESLSLEVAEICRINPGVPRPILWDDLPANVCHVDDGSIVLAFPDPGLYSFLAIGADGGAPVVAGFEVEVSGGLIPESVWSELVDSLPPKVAVLDVVFSAAAADFRDARLSGQFISPSQMFEITESYVGPDSDAWAAMKDRLREVVEAERLTTVKDFESTWLEIARGLASK